MSDPTSLFRSCELFQGLNSGELEEIIGATETTTLDEGDILFEQGTDSEALFVIESGRLEVRSNSSLGEDVVLAELEAGTVVGEMSIIGGGTRSATVEALGESRLFRLAQEDFERLRDQNQTSAYKLILRLARVMGDRRRKTDARIREVFEDPDQHLDDFEQQVHEMLGHLHKV